MNRSSKSASNKQSRNAHRAEFSALESRQMLSAVIYGEDSSDLLFKVSTQTGQVTQVGHMGRNMYDIAENSHGQLFGVDGSSNLYSIDPNTAAITEIGSLGTSLNSLTFSSQGTLYGANSSLYTINTSTGQATRVGSLGGDNSAGDLAFDNHGNLFLTTTANKLAEVNTATGAATDIGAIGFSDVLGLAFGSDSVMYGVSNDTDQIFSINTSTGQGTLVSTMSGTNGIYGATTAPSPVTTNVSGATIYGEDNTDLLFTFNTATGQVKKIGHMGQNLFDIAENAQGQLFGIDSSSNLCQINPTTAAVTEIGSLGTAINSLVFSAQGTLYGAGSSLFTISTTTGQATLVGSLGGDSSAGDLAFDSRGDLFLTTTSNELAQVNTQTGHATDVGPIGFSDVLGLAFGSDGVLYGMSNDTDQIFSINPSTGNGTLVSTMSGIDSIYGAASAPPSSTVSLATSASTVAVGNSVSFTATVLPNTAGGSAMTGTVNFYDNGSLVGSSAVQSDGTATFTATAKVAGTDVITAVYRGNAAFSGSTSSAVTESLVGFSTTTPPVVTAPPIATPAPVKMPASTVSIALRTIALPSTVIAGQSLNSALPVLLTNHGVKMTGTFRVTFYLTGPSLNGTNMVLGTVSGRITLKAGQKTLSSLVLYSLPATVLSGSYRLIAKVTDPKGRTNTTESSQIIRVANTSSPSGTGVKE